MMMKEIEMATATSKRRLSMMMRTVCEEYEGGSSPLYKIVVSMMEALLVEGLALKATVSDALRREFS